MEMEKIERAIPSLFQLTQFGWSGVKAIGWFMGWSLVGLAIVVSVGVGTIEFYKARRDPYAELRIGHEKKLAFFERLRREKALPETHGELPAGARANVFLGSGSVGPASPKAADASQPQSPQKLQ